MPLVYFSIILAIASSALYHFTQKQIPAGANATVSVIVTYLCALALTTLLLYFWPPTNGLAAAVKGLNWASYALAFSLVGLEIGFLLVYRAGWNIGLAAVLVNVAASLVLVPIAVLVFKERLALVNVVGIMVCLVGLVLLNWDR